VTFNWTAAVYDYSRGITYTTSYGRDEQHEKVIISLRVSLLSWAAKVHEGDLHHPSVPCWVISTIFSPCSQDP
jgi:hypothetical protein